MGSCRPNLTQHKNVLHQIILGFFERKKGGDLTQKGAELTHFQFEKGADLTNILGAQFG